MYIDSINEIKCHPHQTRVFMSLDGRLMIAGKFGVQVASGAAIALLAARPSHRVDAVRGGHND